MRSRSVSNNGGTTGISLYITKGTTLKEIRVNLFYMNKCIFANKRFDTFWTQHVYSGIKWSVVCSKSTDVLRNMLPMSSGPKKHEICMKQLPRRLLNN
jgi:hypothetical protein